VEEVTEFLGITADRLIKTLIFVADHGPVAALVRGDHEINEVKLKSLLGSQEITLAEDSVVEKVTRAPRGFAGPVGLQIPIYADNILKGAVNMVTGANKKDSHFRNVNAPRDFTVTGFADLRKATAQDPCGRCGRPLGVRRGIEVGHIFKLGTKYSKALHATYLDPGGKETMIVMGCYGIGVGRTVAAAIEQYHDLDGIIFPKPLAPFQVHLLPVNMKESIVQETALQVYRDLCAAGVEVLLDDRDERPGIKFKDADLIGMPVRITMGSRNLSEGIVEVKFRHSGNVERVPVREVVKYIQEYLLGT
jgi:prolyl-tRNA synthetase